MRRRERGDRSGLAFGHEHPVRRFQRHDRVVLDAAELVRLHVPTRVVPRDPRRELRREAFEPRLVLVRDPRFIGPGDRVHPDQIGASVRRESEAAREDSHRETRESHLEASAIGLHAARRCTKGCGRTAKLFSLAWQAEVTPGSARNNERRVPERVPSVPLDDLGCKLDAGRAERFSLLLGHPADAAGDVVIRNQVLAQDRPPAACFPDS